METNITKHSATDSSDEGGSLSAGFAIFSLMALCTGPVRLG